MHSNAFKRTLTFGFTVIILKNFLLLYNTYELDYKPFKV